MHSQVGALQDVDLQIDIPWTDLDLSAASAKFLKSMYVEIAIKWVCNAITSIAHITKGKVFSNYMVDLNVR